MAFHETRCGRIDRFEEGVSNASKAIEPAPLKIGRLINPTGDDPFGAAYFRNTSIINVKDMGMRQPSKVHAAMPPATPQQR